MSGASGDSTQSRAASSAPRALVRALSTWFFGPLALALCGVALGQFQAGSSRGGFFGAPRLVTPARLRELEAAPLRAVANAIWAFGDFEAARRSAQHELDRLSGVGGPERARVFIRFGLVETSPDGQRALFGQACQDDPVACKDLRAMAQREADARFVAPGNHLPMRLLPNQPHIPGH